MRLAILLLLCVVCLAYAVENADVVPPTDSPPSETPSSTTPSNDSAADFSNVPPIVELKSAAAFRKHALSTFQTALVVFKIDPESVYDSVTAEVCNDLKSSYGPSAYKCYGLDCSLPGLKATCKSFMKEFSTIPAVVSFSGAASKNPYQPKHKAMGREGESAPEERSDQLRESVSRERAARSKRRGWGAGSERRGAKRR